MSSFRSASHSMRQRVRPQLEVNGAWFASLAGLHQPWRAVTVGGPQPAALPAGIRIVDASVKTLGVKAHRVWHAQRDHLAILERDQAVGEVGGGHRDVLAETERVVLVDPRVVARFGTVLANACEAGTWILVEGPAFGTMLAGSGRSIERALALAPVEAHEMAA